MNREILIALLGALLALPLGYALLQSTSETIAPRSERTAASNTSPSAGAERPTDAMGAEHLRTADSNATGLSQTTPLVISPDGSMTPLAAAESEWAQAAASHQAAERGLKESELALNDVEREIEAVDRFFEDLEERGDDPADFAEEGMAKLRPAIERFEARLEIVERNERLEAEARTRLNGAAAELARQRSTSP